MEFVDVMFKTNADGLRQRLKEVKPNVDYNEEDHKYFYNGKQLTGITKLINLKLYGGTKYDSVPEHILKAAADRGRLIHKEIEEYCKSGQLSFTTELERFIDLQKQYGFYVLDNEYVVTDFETYATPIDLILFNDGEIELCDIKTTSKLDLEYLSWQLSINAYLLEKHIGVQVTKLSAYWTRDGGDMYDIERKPNELVQQFLYEDYTGAKELPIESVKQEQFISLQSQIIGLKQQLEILEEQEKEFKSQFLAKMKEQNIESFDLGNIKITRVKPSVRKSIDSFLLKIEMPEIYDKYQKESVVAEYLKVTVRSNND